MMRSRNRTSKTVLLALEADAASTRGGFGCLFSTSDEYEAALITLRRAEGHYVRRRNTWPALAFIACAALVGLVALFAR